MSSPRQTKSKIQSRLEAIKKINDDPRQTVDSVYDKYLSSKSQEYGSKLNETTEKISAFKSDIFTDLLDVSETFLGAPKKIGNRDGVMSQSIMRQHAMNAVKKTMEVSKDIVLDNVKKTFFSGDGICGTDTIFNITNDTIRVKPKEFDFLNQLTVDPETPMGQIIYEPLTPDVGKQKVNRELYKSFTDGPYDFITNGGSGLFNAEWDAPEQEFIISGLNGLKIGDFFNNYYSSVEHINFEHVVKTAMLLTIQSGDQTLLFTKSLNKLYRLLNKLFSICGSPPNTNRLKNQTPIDLFDDNDLEYYFDFNDTEGIDIDSEDARLRGVLKFRDCDNFEIPVNPTILEDFVYFSNKKNINDLIDSTLNRAASQAHSDSDGAFPHISFYLSMIKLFILNLPKALIMLILSPKIFLPILIVYKWVKGLVGQIVDIADLMKKLSTLFVNIIKDIFWKFIREFWKLIKSDLLRFIMVLVKKIIKNKYKRFVVIITALIALLTRILQIGVDNCYDLFNMILSTIDSALASKSSFNVPGIVLGISDYLPGYSQDRAYLNIVERLEASGIKTGPIFGEENRLPLLVKSIIDGNIEEIDTNSYIKVSNKEIKIPTPVGPVIIPPGILNSSGKMF